MLKRFAAENFKAFGKRIEFDLGRPGNYAFNTEAVNADEKVMSKALIYGFNGCGKSVLGLALLDITTHLTDRWRIEDDYIPYLNLYTPVKAMRYLNTRLSSLGLLCCINTEKVALMFFLKRP